MTNRGINFKQYYNLFLNLDNNKTGEITKSQYKNKILELLANDLEKSYLNGHIDKESIKVNNRDYFAQVVVNYYPTMSNTSVKMFIDFLHDSVCFNGMYIQY